jgi:UDP-N-acetylmuramate dehydrogenase
VGVADAYARLTDSISGQVLSDEPMSRHTSWRVGGPAALYVVCDTLADLTSTLRVLDDENVAHEVVGRGTNLLVADQGIDAAVLTLGREFRHHAVEEERITAGAGAMLAAVVQDAYGAGLAGLAFAAGIPGTVGGALAMNAGANEGWIGEIVESITLLVPGDGLVSVRGSDVQWGYRNSGLAPRGIIVEGELRGTRGDPVQIRAEMERYFRKRKMTQPLGVANAGSVFMNPPGDSAGRLIESAGLKGTRIGGAAVSGVHANFVVNEGEATADDVHRLISLVRHTVRETHGIELRTEVRLLGCFEEA